MTEEQQAERLKLIEAAISLALSAWMVWQVMVPASTKQLLRMRLLAAGQRMTATCARRAGAASMRAELRGQGARYEVPYGLSLARERLGRAYDRARGVTL
jgi:hypothetical protein